MLEELNQRLRDHDGVSGRRRPSMWQHSGSAGSLTSSNGSISYTSPQNAPPMPASYRHQSVTAHNMPIYSESSIAAPHFSPPSYHQQSDPYRRPPSNQTYSTDQQTYFQQTSSPPFNFGEPSSAMPQQQQQHHPAHTVAPMQQFAAWSGYGGTSAGNTLQEDEEAAVPPNANPWG